MSRGARGGISVVAVLWVALAAVPAQAAPPPNDDYADAEVTSPAEGLPASATGTTAEATYETGEGVGSGGTIWFRWRATTSGRVFFDGCGDGFGVNTRVYTGETFVSRSEVRSDQLGSANCRPYAGPVVDVVAGRTYRVSLASGSPGGRVSLSISAWTPPPAETAPSASAAEAQVVEGDFTEEGARFVVSLDRPRPHPVTVHYGTTNVSAATVDYTAQGGSLEFAAGETSKVVTVAVQPDLVDEADETFALLLRMPGPSGSWSRGATATILDEDEPCPGTLTEWFCYWPGQGPVRMLTSGDASELVGSIPIKRRARPRVVMRLAGRDGLPSVLEAGDRIEASAELEVSLTCTSPGRRCIGSRYRYDPRVRARLVLSRGSRRAGGIPLSKAETSRCRQRLPHRNHHCILIVDGHGSPIPERCEDCDVNLVVSAAHPKARPGHRLVIGSDTPKGIEGDRGRVNATLVSGEAAAPVAAVRRAPERRRLPVAGRSTSARDRRVLYSMRLADLVQHEQIELEARSRISTAHHPYSTFVGSQIVLADTPKGTSPGKHAGRIAILDGEVTEKNGFNCTSGRSAHSSPCLVEKRGFIRVRRSSDRPVYANLVTETAARFGRGWHRGHRARVGGGGFIRALRHDPLGWGRIFVP